LAPIRADVPLAAAAEGTVASELLVALALPMVVHPPPALHIESDEAATTAHDPHGEAAAV